jgi:hypothetical protein
MHDGLGEGVDGLIEAAFGSAAPVVAALEVELFGFGVGAVMRGDVRTARFVSGTAEEAKGIERDRDEGEDEYGDGQDGGAGVRGAVEARISSGLGGRVGSSADRRRVGRRGPIRRWQRRWN